jgi:putative FmdB family regulatory protein
MPIYEFRCKKCKNIFESLIFSSMEEKKLSCPKCGAIKVEKVMSVSAKRKSNGSSASAGSSCSASSCPPGCSCH